jgi:hypothetical protein
MWIGLGILAVILLLLLLTGVLLPARQQVTRVELFKAPVAEVWEALDNLPGQTQWRNNLKSVQMLDDDAGLRWVEQAVKGRQVTVRKLKRLEQQELSLELRQRGGLGGRSARLNSVPGGTRVTFAETLENRMPFARILSHLQGGVDTRLDGFIQQLRIRFPG